MDILVARLAAEHAHIAFLPLREVLLGALFVAGVALISVGFCLLAKAPFPDLLCGR